MKALRPVDLADIRYALRRWRRRPGFAATAILTLALGIGTTTALFSVIDVVLLQPAPWPAPEQLVAIHAVFPDRRQLPASAATWNRGLLSYQAWDALRNAPAFQDIGAWRPRSLDTTFGQERTDMVETIDVSSNLLPLLGVGLVHGRYFTAAEDEQNSDSVLITYEAWQRRYGGRDDVIGQGAILGSASSGDHGTRIVVGVLEPGFAFGGDPVPEVLLPIGISAEVSRQYPGASLRLVGRLRPGTSIEAASAATLAVVHAVERREPTTSRLVPLVEEHWRRAARPLWLLFGGAALLLLIACSNVAGLLLGEGRTRRHEIALRAALGGSHGRVIRQLVVEHALLAVLSAGCGLLLAHWLIQAFIATAPADMPRLETLAIDARVAVFALGLGALTMLIFGIGPALTLARTPAAEALAQGGRDPGARRAFGLRTAVAAQIALALVLLAGAALLGETMLRLAAQPLGFRPAGLAVVSFQTTWLPGLSRTGITAEEYKALTPAQHAERQQRLDHLWTSGWRLHMTGAMERLSVLPGVLAAAGGLSAPFLPRDRRNTTAIRVAGRPVEAAETVRAQSVTEGYFEVMGVRFLRGRNFTATEARMTSPFSRLNPTTASPRPIVISRELERRFFADNGVGRQLISGSTTYTVIGVVEDVRWRQHAEPDAATCYFFADTYRTVSTLIVRTAGDAAAVLPAMRDTLRAYDPTMVITSTATMDGLLARSVAEERFRASLSIIFGAAALVLSATGLYGLCVRRVIDRRHEIAVRVALGARPDNVRALVFRDAWRTVAIGVAFGAPAAVLAVQITRTLIAGLPSLAAHTVVVPAVVLGCAAVLAMLLPARRAAAIDPMMVLKE